MATEEKAILAELAACVGEFERLLEQANSGFGGNMTAWKKEWNAAVAVHRKAIDQIPVTEANDDFVPIETPEEAAAVQLDRLAFANKLHKLADVVEQNNDVYYEILES
jgi:hypothetical protein